MRRPTLRALPACSWRRRLATAPLVLKTDNGSHFRADILAQLLSAAGAEQLYSPPYWPRYNGAIEASIGSLKSRSQAQAVAEGRSEGWTWSDVAAARREANESVRAKRISAPTPTEAWAERTPLSLEERARVRAAATEQRLVAHAEKAIAADTVLSHWEASAVDREALQRVLVGHAYLLLRRRRIPARIWRLKAAS